MNFTKKQLEEIKQDYKILVWTIVKNKEWGKKLPNHIKAIMNHYNLVLDLIEDLEEKKKNAK